VKPFFSIGVPTFNRHDLLRETLDSILAQDFADFEVIVGNDYTQEFLTEEMIGISDPRVRFVNHPRNLREVGNMNALLAAATGRYFTWLFDDDLIEPGFLRAAHDILLKEDFPPALFPRYGMLHDDEPYRPTRIMPGGVTRLTGEEFLRSYFSRRLKVISTTGFFATENFRKTTGGVEELCDSAIGLYCEYLLLVKCALLGRITYVDSPYVVFRVHSESWGSSNTELNKYLQGGERLVRKCASVLRHPTLCRDLRRNLLGICKIHLADVSFAAMRVEAGAEDFGITAIGRAYPRVLAEISRIRRTYTTEAGCSGLRAWLDFSWIVAKCTYLVLFSFFHYGRKRKRRWQSQASQS
jgi:glycosyltransferase involved in cell wall biosynthesis